MEVYKQVRLLDCKVLWRYFIGEDLDSLCRRYSVSTVKTLSL